MINPMTNPTQAIYQADPNFLQSVKSVQEQLHHAGRNAANRFVRVQMANGQIYEGVIVYMDEDHLYLRICGPASRAFFSPWGAPQNDVILPLVLYNLLVISLLY